MRYMFYGSPLSAQEAMESPIGVAIVARNRTRVVDDRLAT